MRVLITGVARSGTSLTSQICGALGANLGTVNGLFENMPIRENVLKPMIQASGGDRLGQHPLPPRDADPGWKIRDTVEAQLGRDGWAYKGVKMLLVWRNWVREFPDAKWVIVRRDADDIARSCLRTEFMRKYDTHQGWLGWVREYTDRIADLQLHADYIEIWPHKAVSGDLSEYKRMADHCGLTWDQAAVEAVIDRDRWHA